MWETDDMLRPTSLDRNDIVTDAALRLAGSAGISDLTVTGIARGMGVTSQAVLNRYGSADRVRRIVVATSAARWAAWNWRRFRAAEIDLGRVDVDRNRRSLPGALLTSLVPMTSSEVEQTRWWLTWRGFAEQSRGRDGGLARLVAPADEADRHIVSAWLADWRGQIPVDPVRLETVLACVNGLRSRRTHTVDPLAPSTAREVLVCLADQLTDQRADQLNGQRADRARPTPSELPRVCENDVPA